ncbi:copper amine oxidase N-terminal domain-containing protein [Cohnella lupini]|uniref:Copper amine oxidase-like protein n=1 Tax=Cohnella lupini TaxID=1294267 RepID=A0A3D9I719_9BACL|nr:copper amine oxidase N-terminal domain-containing protein [Cohnella lupini]RED57542.1 copper amine oxidase-like protein [Cohnella lupini]
MFTMVRSKSKSLMAILLAAVLIVLIALPVSAAESDGKVEVRLKVGSAQMKIDGVAVKIQAPYVSAGNVMVPLSVFTNKKGFGAGLKLTNNKIITLTYPKHVITLTIGSKSATIDGKKTTLAVAPVNKQGTTMIPLAVITKALGVKLSKDAVTKELILTGTAASGATGNSNSGIDSDSGKSMIGDSYYKWSMNYPTGLVQDKQWSNGDWISFSDVKGDYYMAVSIDESEETLDKQDKRDFLEYNMGEEETIVDVKTITRSGEEIERMVTKENGFFYEYRGFQANGYFYTLIFGKKAKSAADLNANTALLDSFKPVFQASNKSLKDLARIIDGKITYTDDEYGLSIKLPKEWERDTESVKPYYVGPDDSYLLLEVSSVREGDTLDQWVDRKLQIYKDIKKDIYHKTPVKSSIIWNGVPAILVELSYSTDTKNWLNEYEIYAINGTHKYYADLTFGQESKDDIMPVYDLMLKEMKIDFSLIEKSFGEVPDPYDIDIKEVITKTSKENKFSITLPKYWTKGVMDMDSDDLVFRGYGTELHINIIEATGLASSLDIFLKSYQDGILEDGGLRIDSNTAVNFAGVSARKFEISSTELALNSGTVTAYIFKKDEKIFAVQAAIPTISASELINKQVQDAFNSFQFTDK